MSNLNNRSTTLLSHCRDGSKVSTDFECEHYVKRKTFTNDIFAVAQVSFPFLMASSYCSLSMLSKKHCILNDKLLWNWLSRENKT